ncbi:hypothetical protein BD413DRAFT_76905 [Trametes elegans]|nr:hypothetical protein BD413DRAFT_76905 [Trametes elegans]
MSIHASTPPHSAPCAHPAVRPCRAALPAALAQLARGARAGRCGQQRLAAHIFWAGLGCRCACVCEFRVLHTADRRRPSVRARRCPGLLPSLWTALVLCSTRTRTAARGRCLSVCLSAEVAPSPSRLFYLTLYGYVRSVGIQITGRGACGRGWGAGADIWGLLG